MKKVKTINEYSAPETIVVEITLGHIVLASNETQNVEEGNAGDDWYD